MKRRVKLLSTLIVLALLTATFGLAVPSITVEVQSIGEGSSPVSPTICVGGFYFAVGGVVVEFANPLPPGSTVYVALRDYAGNLIASNHTTLTTELPPNTPLLIGFTQGELNNASIPRTSVIVVDGMGDVIYNGTIGVSAQKLSSGKWNGEFAQPINITYNGTKPLKNWPVKIVLSDNSSNNPYGFGNGYIYWDFLSEHLDTIHFVDSEGNLLYYWIEIMNTTDHYAVIWVNVTDIPPGGTQIWMVYGAGNFSSYNNGHKVFWFFDDFEGYSSISQDGWKEYGKGGVSLTNTYNFEFDGSHSAYKGENCDPNGAVKYIGRVINRTNPGDNAEGIILEYWDYRVKSTNCNLDRVGIIYNTTNISGYGGVLNVGNGKIWIETRNNPGGNRITPRTSVAGVQYKKWFLMHLEILSNGTLTLKIYNSTLSLLGSVSTTNSKYSIFSAVYILGGYPYAIDDIRIRPYINPEPTAQVDEWYRYLSSHPACNNQGYSEPSRPIEIVVPVQVDNTNNPQLDNYVVNFSVPEGYFSSGWKYFYVTDENGDYLYFWNFTDKYRGKVYFWVNYTVPSSSTSTIYLHIINEPTSAYENSVSYRSPEKVFWYFNDTLGNISENDGPVLLDFNPLVLGNTYQGYVVDTFMRPIQINNSHYGPYLYVMHDNFYYYYVAMYNLSNALGVDEVALNKYNSNYVTRQNIVNNLTKVNASEYNLLSLVLYSYSSSAYAHYYIYANAYYQGDADSNALYPTFDKPVLGQATGLSSYKWLGIRPYHNPPPTITVENPRLAGP